MAVGPVSRAPRVLSLKLCIDVPVPVDSSASA
jgi:hypothetical protein